MDLVDCFKRLPARTLVDAVVPGTPYRYVSALGPTVDRRTVLPSTVRALMDKNVDSVLGQTPLLLGVTRDEGQIFLSQSDLDEVKSAVYVLSNIRVHKCQPTPFSLKTIVLATQWQSSLDF